VQTIAGNPFAFVGINSQLDQTGTGAFTIANDLTISNTTLTAGGSGSGNVTLAGNINGNGGINQTGTFALVLGGSNTYSGPRW